MMLLYASVKFMLKIIDKRIESFKLVKKRETIMSQVPAVASRPKTFLFRINSQRIRVLDKKGQIVWRTKKELVEQFQGLVGKIASKYQGRGLIWTELVQAGNVGLAVALEKYDLKNGCQFSTFAFWHIRKEIQNALAEIGGKDSAISLDHPVAGADAPLSNAIIDRHVPNPQARILCDELLSQLPPRQRTIVELHDFAGLTFPEIGAKIGRARPTVQKAYKKAMAALQQMEA
jgi:RNA polymerase sigma factor (sigma-70 family)